MMRPNIRGEGRYIGGYTIVEVIIFLAVSGALLFAASFLISGRQQRVQMSQSVAELDSKLQDVFNDVSTGFYPSTNNFRCVKSGDGVSITPGTGEGLGENSDCIFVGKMFHFHAEDKKGSTVYLNDNRVEILTLVASKDTKGVNGVNGDIEAIGYRENVEDPIKGAIERFYIGANVNAIPRDRANGSFSVVDQSGNRYHTIVVMTSFNGSQAGSAPSGDASRVKLYGMGGWKKKPGNTGLFLNEEDLREIGDYVYVCLAQDDKDGTKAALKITKQLTIERQVGSWPSVCTPV